jgi:hypothetical protein
MWTPRKWGEKPINKNHEGYGAMQSDKEWGFNI